MNLSNSDFFTLNIHIFHRNFPAKLGNDKDSIITKEGRSLQERKERKYSLNINMWLKSENKIINGEVPKTPVKLLKLGYLLFQDYFSLICQVCSA